jgi:hypothetical protein
LQTNILPDVGVRRNETVHTKNVRAWHKVGAQEASDKGQEERHPEWQNTLNLSNVLERKGGCGEAMEGPASQNCVSLISPFSLRKPST